MFLLLSDWPSLSHLVFVGHISSRYFFKLASEVRDVSKRLVQQFN